MIPGLKRRVVSLHDVLMYLAIARKHLRLMVLIVSLSLMCGLTFYVFARPVYHAVAIIDIDDLPLPMDTDKIYRDGHLMAMLRQFMAPHIMQRTARALGITAGYRELEKKYVNKLRPTFDSESNLVMEVWAASPELADRWTETMVQEFLADRHEKRRENRDLAAAGYAAEIKEVLTRMDEQLAAKMNFQDQRDLTEALIHLNAINSLPEDLSLLNKRIEEMGRARIRLLDPSLEDDIVAKLSLIASVEEKIGTLTLGQYIAPTEKDQKDNNGGKKESGPPAKGTVVDPSKLKSAHPWDALLQEQQEIKARLETLSKTFLPANPKMAEPLRQLAAIEEKLGAAYQAAQQRFDLKFQELINEKRELEAKIPEYNRIKEKYQRLLTEIQVYARGQQPFEEYLIEMEKKRGAVIYAAEKERLNLHYAGLIQPSDGSVSPNRGKLALLSLAVGLALALAVPFLIEYLDHTLSNLEQVENTFHMRGLGIVPQIEASTTGSAALITHDETRKDALIENFRVIRTNVISMGNLTKQPHVVMVTSAMPKEGKTVVSSNLAVSFAHTGARTLLVDTDLRRGRLHRLFGYRKDPGLSNVLTDEATLEEACRPTGQENLSILSAGRHLDTGTELLGSPRFRELLETLRGRYDRIVIDTPPVLGLSETSMMQTLVDGVLFVIWTGNTPARSAKAAIDTLSANGANFYGFVLNRLDLRATANYYQYYYYSHDYYYQHPLENA